jgi:hypothetical protein
MTTNNKPKIGDCEACDSVNTKITFQYGNMWLCDECWQKELLVQTQVKDTVNILDHARSVDNSVEIKSDLFNAATVAAIELKAAIEQDDSIPSDQKMYAYAKTCMDRMQHMKKVIFEQREELIKNESIARMWLVQTQESAGRLRTEQREHFKNLDVSYQPAKVVKPKAQSVPKKRMNLAEIKEAAAKYDLPHAAVQSIVVSRNMSPVDAATELAKLMGKEIL